MNFREEWILFIFLISVFIGSFIAGNYIGRTSANKVVIKTYGKIQNYHLTNEKKI